MAELPCVTILSNTYADLGLRDQGSARSDDQFDEFRVGLDHLRFAVSSREELDCAVQLLDQRSVPHGGIEDMGKEVGLSVLAFRDPDTIQLELTAPYA